MCICTYKRAALLSDLLRNLESQRTDDLFSFEVVVADNDAAGSAEVVVREWSVSSRLPVTYCVEAQQNISMARNRALAHANGDLLALIDDDEVPSTDWLYELFQASAKYHVNGVLGPVLPRFQTEPPSWITKGKFFDRPRHQTGHPIRWVEARTGNVLLTNGVWRRLDPPFRPQFGSGGEDVDFFRRLSDAGHTFAWCDEAPVYEIVPSYRCTRRFLVGRALLRGSNFPKQSAHRVRNALKSIVAVPCYIVALPILAVVGHHLFIAYLVKLADHTSRLLALAGVRLSTQREN